MTSTLTQSPTPAGCGADVAGQPRRPGDHAPAADPWLAPPTDLRGRALRGGMWTVAAQVASNAATLAGTIILARLVSPEQHGLYAMIATVTGFIMLFGDFGLSLATVQRQDITAAQVSGLFWLNLLLGLVVMALGMALAPVTAAFYNAPAIVPPMLVLCLGFFAAALAVQHQALLRRQMRFGATAALAIIRTVAGIAVGVTLAVLGAGVWALVGMALSTHVATAVLAWRLCSWRPARPRRDVPLRHLVGFGGNYVAFGLVNYFVRNVDRGLIGRVWGAFALGLYSKTTALMLLPIQQLNAPLASVAIATLSRLQDQPVRYRHYYLRAVGLLAFFSVPLGLGLIFAADDIVLLVLGPRWLGAAELFAIMGLPAMLLPVLNTEGWLFVSCGNTRGLLRWGLWAGGLQVLSYVLGIGFGARGVAWAYAGSLAVLALPGLHAAARGTPVSLGDILRTLARPTFAGVTTAAALPLIRRGFTTPASPPVALLLTAGLLAVIYPASTCLYARSLSPLREVFDLLRHRGRNRIEP